MTALAAGVDAILYGQALALVALAVITVQLVVFVMAARRRGRAPLPLRVHVLAGVLLLALPVLGGISVHAARAMMLDVFAGGIPDPMAVSAGITGQLNAIAFTAATMLWAFGLWYVPLTFALRPRRANGQAGPLPPVLLLPFGLVPIGIGAVRWSATIIHAFASMAGLPPDERVVIAAAALDAARRELLLFAGASTIATVVLSGVAMALIVKRARAGADAAAATPRTPARLPPVIAGTAVVALAVLIVAARPMASENGLPWPPPTTGARLVTDEPPTPALVGSDAVERAPVVQIYKDGLGLDGTKDEDFRSLEHKLGTLRNNFKLLNPSGGFNEMVVIVADPTTSMDRLHAVLQAVREAWYHKPLFAFTKTETLVRPTLGTIRRITASGARVRLIHADAKNDDQDEYEDNDEIPLWKAAATLRLADFPAYDGFARRLVELRRAGTPVIVKIDRPRE